MSGNTLAYLATPYTKRERPPCEGLCGAFWLAAEIAGRLYRAGVHVYSPIVHCHAIAEKSGIDPLDLKFWQPICDVMASRCDTLIVAHMDGWQESDGIAHEIEFFKRAGKPIFDLLDVTTCTLVRRLFESDYAPRADHQRERVPNIDQRRETLTDGRPAY